MDQNRKQALAAGCLRIRREIAAWFLMMLWVVFSGSIAEELLGEALPGWVMIGGMILCGVLAVAAHLDNPLRHGYKLRSPRRYLLGAVVILLLVVVLFVFHGQDFAALRPAAIPLIFVWNPICVWLEWKEELKKA